MAYGAGRWGVARLFYLSGLAPVPYRGCSLLTAMALNGHLDLCLGNNLATYESLCSPLFPFSSKPQPAQTQLSK
eukprot:scaffold248446_cov118-Cyclotella_meneghiniana.AAC.1